MPKAEGLYGHGSSPVVLMAKSFLIVVFMSDGAEIMVIGRYAD